jgi:hypothetical protein
VFHETPGIRGSSKRPSALDEKHPYTNPGVTYKIINHHWQSSPFWDVVFVEDSARLVHSRLCAMNYTIGSQFFGFHNKIFFRARSSTLHVCPSISEKPSYARRHWVRFSSPSRSHRAAMEVLKLTSTREFYLYTCHSKPCVGYVNFVIKSWVMVYCVNHAACFRTSGLSYWDTYILIAHVPNYYIEN